MCARAVPHIHLSVRNFRSEYCLLRDVSIFFFFSFSRRHLVLFYLCKHNSEVSIALQCIFLSGKVFKMWATFMHYIADVYKRQPYTLRQRVGQHTFIVYDEIQKKEIGKFHATSFREFYTWKQRGQWNQSDQLFVEATLLQGHEQWACEEGR